MKSYAPARARTSPASPAAPRRATRQSPARAFRRPTPTTLLRSPAFHSLNRTAQSAFHVLLGRLQYEGHVQISYRHLAERLGGRAVVEGRRLPASEKTALRAVGALISGGWIEVHQQRQPGKRDAANVITLGPKGRSIVGLSALASETNLSTPSVGGPEGHINSDGRDPQQDQPACRGGAGAPHGAGFGAGDGEDGEGQEVEEIERPAVQESRKLPPRPAPRNRGRRPDPSGQLLQRLRKGLAARTLTPADERMLVQLSRLCPPAYAERLVGLTGYVVQQGEAIKAVGALLRRRLVEWMLEAGVRIPGEWQDVATAAGGVRHRPEAPKPARSAAPSVPARQESAAAEDGPDEDELADRIDHALGVLGEGADEHADLIRFTVHTLPWADVSRMLANALEQAEDPARGGTPATWFRIAALWDLDEIAGINLYDRPIPAAPIAAAEAAPQVAYVDGEPVQQLDREPYEGESGEWRQDTPAHRELVLGFIRTEGIHVDGLWDVGGRAVWIAESVRKCERELAADFALAVAVARTIEGETGTAFCGYAERQARQAPRPAWALQT